MGINYEGKSVDLANTDGKIYMINNDARTYMRMNYERALRLGIDIEDLQLDSDIFKIVPAGTTTRKKTKLNGQQADKFTVRSGDYVVDVYIVDGQVRRFVEHAEPDDNFVVELTYFSDEVSANDIVPVKDYKEQNFIAFAYSLM